MKTEEQDNFCNNQPPPSPSVEDYGDVLPSFQMHQFMFNRQLTMASCRDNIPPDYEETISTGENVSNFISESSTTSTSYEDTLGDPDKLVLNNLDKLQRINLPFKATIVLTNDFVHHGYDYTTVSPLKEYLPGDMVYGFVVFENKSTIKIPFEILLVSMECEIAIRDPNSGELFKKNILRTYDLEASYNFAEDERCRYDEQRYNPKDDTYTGFSKRLLEPGIKIKKFFKFKIPEYLLDSLCEHQLFEHLKSPPSFGINKLAIQRLGSSNIEISPALGYGRVEGKSAGGTPIKVSDNALSDSYCNYFINVQIIGKNMEIYKPYYEANTLHEYNYIFIKNEEFYFRVGASSLIPYDSKPSNGSTKIQLEMFQKRAIDTLEVMQEREMLNKTGITTIPEQDAIIFSSNGKRKNVYEISEIDEKKISVVPSYNNSTIIEFKQGIFATIEGELQIDYQFDKSSTFKSYLPKVMENMKFDSVYKGGITDKYRPVVKMNLMFKTKKNKNVKLPKDIKINAKLIAAQFYSTKHIPFTIDNDFLENSESNIRKQLKEFTVYYKTIIEQAKRCKTPILRETMESLKALSLCKYFESPFRGIFKPQEINLEKRWKYDDVNDVYKCSVEVPMIVDLNYLEKYPHALLPSFQTCLLARFYKLGVSVTCGRERAQEVCFPVTVL